MQLSLRLSGTSSLHEVAASTLPMQRHVMQAVSSDMLFYIEKYSMPQ